MLDLFRRWRERGWREIDADEYEEAWHQFGGSVATHPEIVGRLSCLARIPVRYLGWFAGDQLLAAIPCWGAHLALAKEVLKQRGRRNLFDLGNAEVILPIAREARVPVRQRMRYVSEINAEQISGLQPQAEGLSLVRSPEEYSPKFRYNQRRELRLFEEAGGRQQAMADLSPMQQAMIYADLFQRRWGFAPRGKAYLGEVFDLLREFMTGSLLLRNDRPVAIQIIYRVEAPHWLSVEYINGGVDPEAKELSPGSVLTYINMLAAWEEARARRKALRFSFGRADRPYKDRWCHRVAVYQR
ncbi:GNAT family N-acetyltransferase [Accumulibacter sp.]|uniref:GNAT family N-acetyltransferase n=1 Tax=Accumulibacter sp. TaxID=2053492 RepID=UPI002BD59CFF|nr:GNAT family N-acetyltransferase [Accumulibacter sp.]HNG87722.1 GNAT family N-acetyltransferase [Accumulibacter sp.]